MDLLKLRKEMKARKPHFVRQDAHKVKRLERKWRKPKGLHSKMRHKFKGYRKLVSKGYKSPSLVKGLSSKGMEMVTVSNVGDLLGLNGTKAAIIAKSVGMRKKLVIIEKANENNIIIMNVKNQKNFKTIFEETRKKEMEEKLKVAEKEDKAEKVSQKKKDEVKDTLESKKELDKVLTKQEK